MKNKKTTVLHVMPSLLSPTGTPKKLLSLVQNADREKFQYVFLLFDNHTDNLCDDIRQAGGIVVQVARPRNYDVRLLFDIMRMIRTYDVDIINTHFARSDLYGVVAGMLSRTPVIKSVHGIFWSPSHVMNLLDRSVAPFRYMTVCNSQASLDAERKRSHSRKLTTIYNGVIPRDENVSGEMSSAFRNRLGIPQDCFLIGHIGGLIGLRRQTLIIDAVKILCDKNINVHFIIAGDGPERNSLEDRIKQLGLEKHVTMLGYRNDIGQLLSIMDVYVNMASQEGFGIAVVEAMYACVPVVLADAGALPELIIDGESGILVPEGDSRKLSDALIRFVEDNEFRQHLGNAGKQRASDKFSIARFVHEFEELYFECSQNTGTS